MRIFSANLLNEWLEVFWVDFAPLLVTDTYIFEVEWFWVTHIGAKLSPHVLLRIAVSELDEVENVVDVWLELVNWYVSVAAVRTVLELASETYVENWERFCADFLRKEEVLVESESVALEVVWEETVVECVVPTVFVERTVFNRTYSVLPLVASLEVCTFNDTSAWEAEHAWLQVVKSLSEVLTHTVLVAFPCVNWEEAHVLKVNYCTAAVEHDAECTLVDCLVSLDYNLVFLPLLRVDLHHCLAELLALVLSLRVAKHNADAAFTTFWNACPY